MSGPMAAARTAQAPPRAATRLRSPNRARLPLPVSGTTAARARFAPGIHRLGAAGPPAGRPPGGRGSASAPERRLAGPPRHPWRSRRGAASALYGGAGSRTSQPNAPSLLPATPGGRQTHQSGPHGSHAQTGNPHEPCAQTPQPGIGKLNTVAANSLPCRVGRFLLWAASFLLRAGEGSGGGAVIFLRRQGGR